MYEDNDHPTTIRKGLTLWDLLTDPIFDPSPETGLDTDTRNALALVGSADGWIGGCRE